MTVVEDQIEIRAPIKMVFEAITDPRRTMEWNTNIAGVHDLQTYPPARLGSTWTQVAVIAGKRVDLHCKIVAWHPPHEGVLEVAGGQRATITTRCEEAGDVTRVTQSIDFTPPGGRIGALAGGVMGKAVKKEMTEAMRRQKKTIESEVGEPSGSGAR